jgi:hypothetical protein
MNFTTNNIICIYNIVFHILNIFLKISIQIRFKFYINYYEVNINYIYHLICLKMKSKIEIVYLQYCNNTDLNGYV